MNSSKVIWLTGLPCSGKSTIAKEVAKLCDVKVFDGDTIRAQVGNQDFSYEGRVKQAHQVATMASNWPGNVIVAIVSPFKECRSIASELLKDRYVEVYVKCTLETCVNRDVKGMYEKAKKGEIKQFTGISSPYDIPENPHLVLDTEKLTVEQCARTILCLL